MSKQLNTTTFKIAMSVFIALAVALSVSASFAVRAEPLGDEAVASAFKSAKCFIFGRAMGLDHKELKVYVDRVGKLASNPNVIYSMGYQEGALDVYGSLNAKSFGSFNAAKMQAATHFYNALGCTTGLEM